MVNGRYRLNEPQVTAKVMDGEAVIIHLGTGVYYSMEGVGCLVWEGLTAGNHTDAIVDGIAGRYAIDRSLAEADISRLLGELVAQDLVVPADDATAARPFTGQVAPASYASPALNRYDDMADLLALDPPLPASPR
jgi:hypothetical protein